MTLNNLFYAMMMLLTGGLLGYTLGEASALSDSSTQENARIGGVER